LTGEGDDVSPPAEDGSEPDPQLKATLAELRSLRGDMLRMGEKLGRLEKSLRVQMTQAAENG
jgi:hypothetical protein